MEDLRKQQEMEIFPKVDGEPVLALPVGALLVYTFTVIAVVVLLYIGWVYCKRQHSVGGHRKLVYRIKDISARVTGHKHHRCPTDPESLERCSRDEALLTR